MAGPPSPLPRFATAKANEAAHEAIFGGLRDRYRDTFRQYVETSAACRVLGLRAAAALAHGDLRSRGMADPASVTPPGPSSSEVACRRWTLEEAIEDGHVLQYGLLLPDGEPGPTYYGYFTAVLDISEPVVQDAVCIAEDSARSKAWFTGSDLDVARLGRELATFAHRGIITMLREAGNNALEPSTFRSALIGRDPLAPRLTELWIEPIIPRTAISKILVCCNIPSKKLLEILHTGPPGVLDFMSQLREIRDALLGVGLVVEEVVTEE